MATPKKLRFEIFKRDSFTCQYCGSRPPAVVLELDHIDPKSNGGGDQEENLITSCFDCNRGKGARELKCLIPSSSEKLERIKEAELQLHEYRKVLAKREKRVQADLSAVNGAFCELFPGEELTKNFLETSVRRFLEGLPTDKVVWAMRKGGERFPYSSTRAIKYFCGICWRILKDGD